MSIQTFLEKLDHILDGLSIPDRSYCHICGQRLYYEGCCLCESCQTKLERFRIPFSDNIAIAEPLTACVSAFQYEEPARNLVIHLKFDADTICAEPLYFAMAQAVQQRRWNQFIDLIVPVPLHEQRYRARGYNQSTKLAEPMGCFLSIPVSETALKRIRNTGTQVKRTGTERRTALAHAFEANPSEVEHKNILLVDDVFTTGSTGVACAEALLECGAKGVWMVTACRA